LDVNLRLKKTNVGKMRMWPSAEIAAWLYNLANIGLILGLVVGVVSTILVVWMGNVKEAYLNRLLAESRERTASLEKQAGESQTAIAKANADAAQSLATAKQAESNLAEANERAAKAHERAAQAEQKAAEAQLALEKFKAPRVLSPRDQQVIIKVSKFAGQEYSVTTFWDLKESHAFSNQLHQTLLLAGWKYIPPGEGGSFLLGGLAGVQVWVHPAADPPVRAAADALVSALEQIAQAPTLKLQNPRNANDNKIHLNVGTKS
jgi:hypothetical protein